METPKKSGFLSNAPLRRVAGVLTWLAPMLLTMLWASGCLTAAQKPKPTPKAVARADAALLKARSQVLGARPLGMYYYHPDALALDSLQAHAGQMALLGPQCFFVDTAGIVRGEIPAQVMEFARQANVPVMPLLVNPGFNRALAHGLLSNSRAQERAAAYLAYLAKRDNYVGWQLDLEYLAPADKQRYSRFVARVAARLHRDKRLLSVAVVPRFSDAYPDKRPAEFRTGEWGAPYDFRALSRVADFLTLMTYNQHSSASPPGPVAGYAWVRAALDYAVRRVPRSKLLLGIPFYGREWVTTPQGTVSSSLPFKDVKPLLESLTTPPRWHERWRTTWFQYGEGSTQRTAWFEDSRSLREKLALMRSYKLRGFAAWRLGVEDPQFWLMVAEFGKKAPVVRARRVSKKPPRLTSGGSASDPR